MSSVPIDNAPDLIRIGIMGGTGYTGAELLRILARHPGYRFRSLPQGVRRAFRSLICFRICVAGSTLRFSDPDSGALADCDLVFFATPNGTAMRAAPNSWREAFG